jgi:hypothetical protein
VLTHRSRPSSRPANLPAPAGATTSSRMASSRSCGRPWVSDPSGYVARVGGRRARLLDKRGDTDAAGPPPRGFPATLGDS